MHSSEPCFPEIIEKVCRLPIEKINEKEYLKEHSIEVISIQKACLIVDIKITKSNANIPLCMKCVVESLMRSSNAFQVLCDNDVDELNIFGYFYQPSFYLEKSGKFESSIMRRE